MIQGFDVSFYQDNNYTPVKIDFKKMENYARFVIIRQGQGNYTDEDFRDYWRDAKQTNMVRMAYHFFSWDVSPELQAEKFVSDLASDPPDKIMFKGQVISGYWGDFEWWSEVPSNALSLYLRFARRVKDLTGIYPGIYTAPGFWKDHGSKDPIWAEMPLWIAHWGVLKPTVPAPWKEAVIWQWGTPAIGLEVGVESKEIDANLFLGTEEELFYFKRGGEMSNPYETYAKVLYIDENSVNLTVDLIKKYDVILAKGVIGETLVPGFHNQVQMIFDAGKPCIMFFENHTHIYVSYNLMPGLNDDPQWKAIKRALFSGDKLRAIHGVMVNSSQTHEPGTNKVIPDMWIARVANHMLDLIEKGSGLKTFLYMDKNPINAWPRSNHLINLIDQRGISTYSAVSNLVNGVPANGIKPDLAYWGKFGWNFWLYKYNAATKTIDGIYCGSKEALYKQLNYQQSVPPTPPVPEPPTPPPPSSELENRVKELENQLKNITDRVAKLENGIWKFQG